MRTAPRKLGVSLQDIRAAGVGAIHSSGLFRVSPDGNVQYLGVTPTGETFWQSVPDGTDVPETGWLIVEMEDESGDDTDTL